MLVVLGYGEDSAHTRVGKDLVFVAGRPLEAQFSAAVRGRDTARRAKCLGDERFAFQDGW